MNGTQTVHEKKHHFLFSKMCVCVRERDRERLNQDLKEKLHSVVNLESLIDFHCVDFN